jgi:hypothetical protein
MSYGSSARKVDIINLIGLYLTPAFTTITDLSDARPRDVPEAIG